MYVIQVLIIGISRVLSNSKFCNSSGLAIINGSNVVHVFSRNLAYILYPQLVNTFA